MNRIYYVAMAMALACSAGSVLADDNPDAAFYKKAAEGGIAEVEMGKLAQAKSSNASVKDFGAMMVSDTVRQMRSCRRLLPRKTSSYRPAPA